MANKILRTDKKIIDEKFLTEWFAKLSNKRQQEIIGEKEFRYTPKELKRAFSQMDFTNQIGWYFIYQ